MNNDAKYALIYAAIAVVLGLGWYWIRRKR